MSYETLLNTIKVSRINGWPKSGEAVIPEGLTPKQAAEWQSEQQQLFNQTCLTAVTELFDAIQDMAPASRNRVIDAVANVLRREAARSERPLLAAKRQADGLEAQLKCQMADQGHASYEVITESERAAETLEYRRKLHDTLQEAFLYSKALYEAMSRSEFKPWRDNTPATPAKDKGEAAPAKPLSDKELKARTEAALKKLAS